MLTDARTDTRTDGRTDKPSYRDARTHLKTKRDRKIKDERRNVGENRK